MWYIYPVLYLAIVLIGFFDTSTVKNIVPNLTFVDTNMSPLIYTAVLPSDPSTVIKLCRITQTESENKLKMASDLLKYDFKSENELILVMTELEHMTDAGSGGIIGKFLRVFTLVNLVWLISSIVMVILFGPVMFKIFGPLLVHLTNLLYEIAVILYKFREEIGYIFITFLLTQSYHFRKDVGFYLAFTSILGFYALFTYSLNAHIKVNSSELGKLITFSSVIAPTLILTLIFESYLMGFITVILTYLYFGFSVIATSLTYYVGFKDKDSLNQCIGASLIMLPIYLIVQTSTLDLPHLKYFKYGFYVFGFVVYFLALLIKSSKYSYRSEDYGLNQFFMLISLVATMCTGTWYNIQTICNIGTVFSFMYGLEKFIEFDIWKNNGVVLVFLVALIFYCLSFWLNTHPSFVMDVLMNK